MGNLLVLGFNPELIDADIEKHLGFTFTMSGIIVALLLGVSISIGVSEYCRPRVLQYVRAPKDIEVVRDGLIALGSFVTRIESTIDLDNIKRIFSYINQQLVKISKRLDRHDERIRKLEDENEMLLSHSARQNRNNHDLNQRLKRVEKELEKTINELIKERELNKKLLTKE